MYLTLLVILNSCFLLCSVLRRARVRWHYKCTCLVWRATAVCSCQVACMCPRGHGHGRALPLLRRLARPCRYCSWLFLTLAAKRHVATDTCVSSLLACLDCQRGCSAPRALCPAQLMSPRRMPAFFPHPGLRPTLLRRLRRQRFVLSWMLAVLFHTKALWAPVAFFAHLRLQRRTCRGR